MLVCHHLLFRVNSGVEATVRPRCDGFENCSSHCLVGYLHRVLVRLRPQSDRLPVGGVCSDRIGPLTAWVHGFITRNKVNANALPAHRRAVLEEVCRLEDAVAS